MSSAVKDAFKRAAVRGTLRTVGPALRRRRPAEVRPAELRRILLLQLQNVGDTLIFSPALQALRRRYPAARIDILANAVSAQIYKRCPLVDRLWVDTTPGSARKLLPPISLLRGIRAERYDAVVADITQNSLRYGLIASLCGAPLSIGFDLDERGFLFTRPLAVPNGASFVECNLLLARELGADAEGVAETFWYAPADDARAASLLATRGIDPERPLVVMHPASNWQSKTWFPDRWAAVADWLAREEGAQVAFVGTAAESAYVDDIRARMETPSVSLAGQTDLPELGAVLARADLFVGTDSGPRHIAGALGRPQVTVMSSLDYAHRWGLRRPNEIVLRTDPECSGCQLSFCGHRRCMDLIDVSRVRGACAELLARTRATATVRAGAAIANPTV